MFIDRWDGESQARKTLLGAGSEQLARARLTIAQSWLARMAQSEASSIIIDFDASGARMGNQKEGQPGSWEELMEAFKQETPGVKESSMMEVLVVARIGALRVEGRLKAVSRAKLRRAGLWALRAPVDQAAWIASLEAQALKEQSQSAEKSIRAEGRRL